MRNIIVRRSVVAASAFSLALLATACGSDKSTDNKDEPKAGSSSAPAAPAVKGKTDAEVKALLVTQADLPDQIVSSDEGAQAVAEGAGATVDKAECKVLMQAQFGQKVGAPSGVGLTVAKDKLKEPAADASPEDKLKAGLEAIGSTQTLVNLGSYDGKGAEEAFAAVKTAATACSGGYTVTNGAENTKFLDVKPGSAVTAGDEAAAYTLTMDLEDGDKTTVHFVVVRKGNTLSSFSALGVVAKQPKTVIDAQVKKLG
ncbi:hypothetical protein [Streptomyces vinaceus]|uniref:hypothetical protein n=1 Tax=Streptomyces vinaceus TaxID=1960 RepID=UPI0036CEDA57